MTTDAIDKATFNAAKAFIDSIPLESRKVFVKGYIEASEYGSLTDYFEYVDLIFGDLKNSLSIRARSSRESI